MTHADPKLNVVVLAASLRGESLNRRLAELSARSSSSANRRAGAPIAST